MKSKNLVQNYSKEELIEMILGYLPQNEENRDNQEYQSCFRMAIMYAEEGDMDLAISEMLFAEKAKI